MDAVFPTTRTVVGRCGRAYVRRPLSRFMVSRLACLALGSRLSFRFSEVAFRFSYCISMCSRLCAFMSHVLHWYADVYSRVLRLGCVSPLCPACICVPLCVPIAVSSASAFGHTYCTIP
jgi:hypothetical protein